MAFQGSAEGSGATIETGPCPICQDEALGTFIQEQRFAGNGYRRSWHAAKAAGFLVGKHTVARHFQHSDRTMSAVFGIGDAQDNAEFEVNEDYFVRHGIQQPGEGWKIRAATVVERDEHGRIVAWPRVAPETEDEERIEIRQAEPVEIQCTHRQSDLVVHVPGDWYTAMLSPDIQIGYSQDSTGNFHCVQDERCVDVGHQVALAVANDEGLDMWLDCGDFLDLAAPSKYAPNIVDAPVACLNKAVQRGCDEVARRRHAVGPEGEVVVLDANHTIRLRTKATETMPYLVGLRRANDPDDDPPVLSVPFLCRFKDYGVEFPYVWPSGYRILNENFVAVHSPAYGAKALQTASKIGDQIEATVVFGHVHRREQLAVSRHTIPKGRRTWEIFSDGCWARTDGNLPSARNTYDDNGDRMTATANSTDKVGYISEQMDQGFTIAHIERSGRNRFSLERVIVWDGWCQFRGQTFTTTVDVEGSPLNGEQTALLV